MAAYTVLGTGTITLGDTPEDFSGEFLNVQVTHEYEDVGDTRTMLDGSVRAAGQQRTDGLTGSVENDLTATGLYKYLLDNDGSEVAFVFTPNTVDAASWAGTVKCRLPGSVGADEYGAPLVGDIELPGVGTFSFTPGA